MRPATRGRGRALLVDGLQCVCVCVCVCAFVMCVHTASQCAPLSYCSETHVLTGIPPHLHPCVFSPCAMRAFPPSPPTHAHTGAPTGSLCGPHTCIHVSPPCAMCVWSSSMAPLLSGVWGVEGGRGWMSLGTITRSRPSTRMAPALPVLERGGTVRRAQTDI